MKLLLASNGKFLIDEGYGLLGIPAGQIRIGYVTTASKQASDTGYIERHKQAMLEKGLNFTEIDIEGKTKEELEELFSGKNILHMEGGHTGYLLQIIRETGFDEVIKELLERGVVYVGTSAGSSVVGPTIELSSHLISGSSREDLIGLGLVPFLIKAHYSDDKAAEYKERLKAITYPVKFLRDGQALLIDENSCKLVGSGSEVNL